MTEGISRRAFVAALALIALVAVGVRLHLLDQPLDRDEGLYAYMAQRMLAGDVPYRDTFSDKPPVAFLVYATTFVAFGQTAWAIHLGGAIWAASAALLVAALARRLHGPTTGIVAGLLFAVSSAEGSLQGSSINLELLLAVPATAALLVVIGPRVSWRRSFAAGALVGVALLTKQQAIGHAAFAAVWLAVRWRSDRERRIARLIAHEFSLMAGAIAVFALSLVVFASLHALGFYLDGIVGYNFGTYVEREPFDRAWGNFARSFGVILQGNPMLYLAALLGLGFSLRTRSRESLFTPVWLLFNAAAVAVGLRFYRHYFLLTQPAIVILAACAVGRFLERAWTNAAHRSLRATAAAVAALTIVSPLAIQRGYFFQWPASEHVRELYGQEIFSESQRLADFIATHSEPNEPMFIFGSEPQIHFLARRRAASRYAFVHPLTARGAGPLQRQQEAIEQLERERPPFVLTIDLPTSQMLEPGFVPHFLDRFAELLARDYSPVLAVRLRIDRADYELAAPDRPIQSVGGDPTQAILFERRDRQAR